MAAWKKFPSKNSKIFDMTTAHLRKAFPNGELSDIVGNGQVRRAAFIPLFENLYENKFVYFERGVTQIALVENMNLSPSGFWIHALSHEVIKDDITIRMEQQQIRETWEFGCRWDELRLVRNYLSSYYATWRIWPDAALVEQTERLVLNRKYAKALSLTIYEEKDIHAIYDDIEEITSEEIEGFYHNINRTEKDDR